jgi:hypothetical protein
MRRFERRGRDLNIIPSKGARVAFRRTRSQGLPLDTAVNRQLAFGMKQLFLFTNKYQKLLC